MPDKDLAALVETSDIPILIAGKNEKIIYKNEAAKRCRIPIRVGAHLKNYISEPDMKRITRARDHDFLPISLNSGDTYNCIIQKHGADLIIKILNLSALSIYRISQFSEYTEGRMKYYSLLINSLLNDGEKANITSDIAKKLMCMVKLQSRMNDYIKLCENTYSRCEETLPLYASAKPVIETINTFLPHLSVKIETGSEIDNPEMICVRITRTDLYSLITYLVSFAVRYLHGSEITVHMNKYSGSIVLSADGETLLSEDAAKAICSFDTENVFPTKYPDLIFSVSVCKALAEHYGWRFCTVASGIGFSRVKAALFAPITDETPPLDLHKPKDIAALASIIEEEFADLEEKI